MLLVCAMFAADAEFWQGVQRLLLHASVARAVPFSQPLTGCSTATNRLPQ